MKQRILQWLGIDFAPIDQRLGHLEADLGTEKEERGKLEARVHELEQDYARNYTKKDEVPEVKEPISPGRLPYSVRRRMAERKRETK